MTSLFTIVYLPIFYSIYWDFFCKDGRPNKNYTFSKFLSGLFTGIAIFLRGIFRIGSSFFMKWFFQQKDGRGFSTNPEADESSDHYDFLKCIICMEIPQYPTPIYQCSEGHIICKTCLDKIEEKDWICRLDLTTNLPSRNRIAETMLYMPPKCRDPDCPCHGACLKHRPL